MFYVDETESWENSFEKENDGKLKFPISIHEVSVLENLGEISESVTYVAPKLKPTNCHLRFFPSHPFSCINTKMVNWWLNFRPVRRDL